MTENELEESYQVARDESKGRKHTSSAALSIGHLIIT